MFRNAIVGQDQVVAYLERVVGGSRMPHALLFHGPEGVGKAAAALEAARALHCENPYRGACGACRSCRRVQELNHPDMGVLFPFRSRTSQEAVREALISAVKDPYGYAVPEDAATLSVDRVRELQRRFSHGTFEGSWRSAVILHAHRMRAEAANALLKTLEEPPARSLLILSAPSPSSLLPTIVSRCQSLKFQPLSTRVVTGWLRQHYEMAEDEALFVARASGGSLRKARDLAEGDAAEAQQRAARFLLALVSDEVPATHAALEQLAADRNAALQVLADAQLWLRDALLYAESGTAFTAHQADEASLRRLCDALSPEAVEVLARRIEAIREMNRRNVSLSLALMSLWREARRLRHRTTATPT